MATTSESPGAGKPDQVTDELGSAGPRRMVMVCPPFQVPNLASMATTHLATLVRERGGSCAEAYPHFELAGLLGVEKYGQVGGGTNLAGELLFAEGLHGVPREPELVAMLDEAFGGSRERAALREAFEARVLLTFDYGSVELVGITTSFNQLMAALWLTRVLKRQHPALVVALGGAACVSPMGAEVLAGYPEVDYVVSGWGEAPLLQLSRGELPPRQVIECLSPVDLDALPIPDFGPLLAVAATAWRERSLALAFESSRGCWWGQKHHCRFCGVNGPTLRYHSKSSDRVVREIRTLWERHHRELLATDAVLSRDHLEEVMPELARFADGPRIFYELRTNVTAPQMDALARARVQGQPGIESLSTRLLELLGKGLTGIQNLAFLKWATERRISVAWNLLYGIPGERVADYEQQMALIARIPQLQPPGRINPIHLARHSPYFEERDSYGWAEVEPLIEYRGMHPQLDPAARFRIAKYFQGRRPVDPEPYRERLDQTVRQWRTRHARGDGLFLDPDGGLVRNEAGTGRRYSSSALLHAVLDLTHEITTLRDLMSATGARRPLLQGMEDEGLLYVERERVVNLAVRTRYVPAAT